MKNFSVSQIDKTRRLKLSKWQLFWHYILGIFLIAISLYYFYNACDVSVKNSISINCVDDGLLVESFSLLFGLGIILSKWYRLKFRQFDISLTPKEFKDKIAQISKQQKWSVENNTNNYARIYAGSMFTWGLNMTIIRRDNYILVNSLCDPDRAACISIFFENERNIAHLKKFLKTSNDEGL